MEGYSRMNRISGAFNGSRNFKKRTPLEFKEADLVAHSLLNKLPSGFLCRVYRNQILVHGSLKTIQN